MTRRLLLICLTTAAVVSSQETPVTEEVTINTQAATRPFPHFWEQMFGPAERFFVA